MFVKSIEKYFELNNHVFRKHEVIQTFLLIVEVYGRAKVPWDIRGPQSYMKRSDGHRPLRVVWKQTVLKVLTFDSVSV